MDTITVEYERREKVRQAIDLPPTPLLHVEF